jgi:hypothetical protein
MPMEGRYVAVLGAGKRRQQLPVCVCVWLCVWLCVCVCGWGGVVVDEKGRFCSVGWGCD